MAKIILTARDVGGAGHIGAIAGALDRRGQQTRILAQGKAVNALNEMGARSDNVDEVFTTIPDGKPLSAAKVEIFAEILASTGIDAVVNAMSTFGSYGVDEAVFIAARQQNIPTFTMQDFWGDVERVNGATADHTFVLDEFAASLTVERVDGEVHVVGSCRHSASSATNDGSTANLRTALNANRNQPVIAFFGQDLVHMAGYRTLLRDFAASSQRADSSARLAFRPHPRENEASAAASLKILRENGGEVLFFPPSTVEEAISASDVLVSAFSTVGLDAVYRTKQAGQLSTAVVYADYPDEMAAFWREQCNLPRAADFPLAGAGYALSARNKDELESKISRALDPQVRAKLETTILKHLPAAETAADRAATIIENVVGNSAIANAAE